jgi:CubicO group peptidase (beta-lactamase class C family)
MNKITKTFLTFLITSLMAAHSVSAVTTEQILEFRLERIPRELKDPTRAILFSPSNESASKGGDFAENKSEYFAKINNNPNNVAIGYWQDGKIFTSLKYQSTENTPFFVYSITKFMIGFLIADQVCKGNLEASKTMGDLSLALRNTAYKDIAFSHVLEMSSGVSADAESRNLSAYREITRKGISMLEQLTAHESPDLKPGSKFEYSGRDSNALTFAIKDSTGKNVAELFEAVIWKNINSSHNGYWLKDASGLPVGAFGLALSASDLLRVGSFIASRISSEKCLSDYYTGDGIVVGGDKTGLANWRHHSWVNPKNLSQFGGSGYGGQLLMFDTSNGKAVFLYSNYNDKYDESPFAVAWRLLDELQ